MKTTTFTLALTALAALSFARATQLAPAQRAEAAPRADLTLSINEADLMSFSIRSGGMAAGSGGGTGKASFSDLSLMKSMDKSSPMLAQKVAAGKHFPKAVLFVRKAGKEQHDFYQIMMEDVTVSSFQVSPSSGGDRPMESLSLNFAKIEIRYMKERR